jgi:hypothetical protein
MADKKKLCGTGAGFLMAMLHVGKDEGWTDDEMQEMVDMFTKGPAEDSAGSGNDATADETEVR